MANARWIEQMTYRVNVAPTKLQLQQPPPQQPPPPPAPDSNAAAPLPGEPIPALTLLRSGILARLSQRGQAAEVSRSAIGRRTSKVAAQSPQRYS